MPKKISNLVGKDQLGNLLPSGVVPGERVVVKTKELSYEGLLIENPSIDNILLKLNNGYNVGIKTDRILKINRLNKQSSHISSPKIKNIKMGLPKISMIATGGTIASRVDYNTGAVSPLTKPSELIASITEIANLADVGIINLLSMSSEDMTQDEWSKITKAVIKELKSDSRGVILTQGTDTIGYTAAALSFALGDINKPVAIVGGQRSSDRGSFDGAQNLITAVHYCLSDINQVAVVMHGSESDDFSLAILGTKVRKMHTSRRDAFRPINALPLAKIWPNGKIEKVYLQKQNQTRSKLKVVNPTKFSKKVALVKFVPGLHPDVIDYYISEGYKGIIIEGTGLGHVSTMEPREYSWMPAIRRAIKSGVFIGIAPQTLYGSLDPYVYSSGRQMLDAGVVHLKDILPETAYIKLCWVLEQTKDKDEIRSLMLSNLAGEISDRELPNEFLY